MASLFGLSETDVVSPFGIHENILNDNAVSFGGDLKQQNIATGIINQLQQTKATGATAGVINQLLQAKVTGGTTKKNPSLAIPVSTEVIPTPTLMILVDTNTNYLI